MNRSNLPSINDATGGSAQSLPRSNNGRPRVLIVDDEPRVLRALRAALKADFEVEVAVNADSAIQSLQQTERFDVIVCDDRMLNCSGLELLSWSKNFYPDSARILLSSTEFSNKQEAIQQADLYRCVQKPWNTKEFIEILNRAVLKTKPGDRSLTTKRGRFGKERRSGLSRFCSVAVLDLDSNYRNTYRQVIRDNTEISEIYYFDTAADLLATLSHTAGIGIVVVDLAIGDETVADLIRVLNQRYSSVMILVTSEPGSIRNFTPLVAGQSVCDFIAKPISAKRIQPLIGEALKRHFVKKREQ